LLHSALADAESARETAINAERFIHGIVSSIPDPLIVQDSEWRIRYLNPAAVALLERSRRRTRDDAAIGQPTLEVYHRLRGTAFEKAMQRAAAERRAVTLEAFVARRAEWWEMSCYPLPDGGLASRWKDVTERKRTEETSRYLAKASEILGSSLDYETTLSEVARLVVPELADWCIVDIVVEGGSTRQLAIAHVEPEKVRVARELSERYPPQPDSPTGVANVLRTGRAELYSTIPDELLAAGAVDAEHLRIIRELGPRSAMIVPLTARDRVLGALTLVSAESGRRYMEADLELATELARRTALAVENARLHRAAVEANEAKVRFLAVMSHEFRTPLNAIAGYAELLRLGLRGPVTPEQVDDLDRITRSELTLLGLINDILNYARLEAGHVRYATDRVRVRELLTDLEGLVLPQLRAKRLRLDVGTCDPDLAVHADTDKVRQILVNLLSNAIKFTPADGSIAIECEAHETSVRIFVSDTGVGIPAEKLHAIFEPFVQLDRNLTSVQEGSGLGLAISRDLARGMGGDLSAESTPGTGSTFVLTLGRAR
jgi:signal transduction histidine kinase